MPKMCAILPLVSAPLNSIPIVEHSRRSQPQREHNNPKTTQRKYNALNSELNTYRRQLNNKREQSYHFDVTDQ